MGLQTTAKVMIEVMRVEIIMVRDPMTMRETSRVKCHKHVHDCVGDNDST